MQWDFIKMDYKLRIFVAALSAFVISGFACCSILPKAKMYSIAGISLGMSGDVALQLVDEGRIIEMLQRGPSGSYHKGYEGRGIEKSLRQGRVRWSISSDVNGKVIYYIEYTNTSTSEDIASLINEFESKNGKAKLKGSFENKGGVVVQTLGWGKVYLEGGDVMIDMQNNDTSAYCEIKPHSESPKMSIMFRLIDNAMLNKESYIIKKE